MRSEGNGISTDAYRSYRLLLIALDGTSPFDRQTSPVSLTAN